MDETLRKARAYLIHDPVANMEGYATDYDPDHLRAAQDAGMVILAEYADGSRARVDASEVSEPQPEINGVTLVQPAYVDERTRAVVDVFDALASELPARSVSVMSADNASESNAVLAMTAMESPFLAALERLKVIVNGHVER